MLLTCSAWRTMLCAASGTPPGLVAHDMVALPGDPEVAAPSSDICVGVPEAPSVAVRVTTVAASSMILHETLITVTWRVKVARRVRRRCVLAWVASTSPLVVHGVPPLLHAARQEFCGAIGPVGPVGPVAPAGPVGPVGPAGPVAPVGPVGPGVPAEPVGPVAPCRPVGPAPPVGPVVPVGPAAPVGPVAPVAPL